MVFLDVTCTEAVITVTNHNVQGHFCTCGDLEEVADALFLWVIFFQLLLSDASFSVACTQYGSANVEKEEEQSSKESENRDVLPSITIPLASPCHIHNATAGVSSSHSLLLSCLYTFICLFPNMYSGK